MMTDKTRSVAIVGRRSLIGGRNLKERLGSIGCSVTLLDKADLSRDMSGFDCVYLVLGRARPNADQEEEERRQLNEFIVNPLPPKRMVYISSMALTESKRACEKMIDDTWRSSGRPFAIIRPPAVFGPGQSLDSPMLIPGIVKSRGKLKLQAPNNPTWFISIDDLSEHLARFSDLDWWDPHQCAQPDSSFMIPGSFCLTPRQVLSLYETFMTLEARAPWECDEG